MRCTISVVIINYNKEKYLKKCLDSVLTSSSLPEEIIVVDDCSTDSSLEIIESFTENNTRLKLIKNEFNIGASATRHKGIMSATSDFIMTLDGDDWFETDFIKIARDEFNSNPNIILSGNFNVIDETEKVQFSIDTKVFSEQNKRQKLYWLASRKKGIPGNQISILKKNYIQLGGLDKSLKLYEDWDFQLRIMESKIEWKYLKDICYNYRKSGDGLSSSSQKKHFYYKYLVFKKNIKKSANKVQYFRGIVSIIVFKGFKYVFGDFNKYGYN